VKTQSGFLAAAAKQILRVHKKILQPLQQQQDVPSSNM